MQTHTDPFTVPTANPRGRFTGRLEQNPSCPVVVWSLEDQPAPSARELAAGSMAVLADALLELGAGFDTRAALWQSGNAVVTARVLFAAAAVLRELDQPWPADEPSDADDYVARLDATYDAQQIAFDWAN